MNIRVIALPTETLQKVLATMTSPGYNHPASTDVATGHGPCRHCLKPFRVGQDRRILFTCNPFYNLAEIPLPGPVFVHDHLCDRFREDSGYPSELLDYPAVMDAYDANQNLVLQRRASNRNHPSVLDEIFSTASVRYVLVRDLKAGCFDFRVERNTEREPQPR